LVSEKDKENIKIRADLEKASALAEQKMSYIGAKAQEDSQKLQILQQENTNIKQKNDEKDRLIAVFS